MTERIRIGTRGSALALAQTQLVADALTAEVETRVVRTTGDRIQDRPLPEIGGKGLFTSELETALLEGRIDAAVHSMKDMPTEMDARLTVGAVPTRGNPFDALVTADGSTLKELPEGARVGTSSRRRAAQLLAVRPDLNVEPIRGNVDTRLRKLRGDARRAPDALALAAAGMERLGLGDEIVQLLKPPVMLPAVGQGALCIQTRTGDAATLKLLQPAHDEAAWLAVQAERAFLRALGGGCHTPIAAYAVWTDKDGAALTGRVLNADGSKCVEGARVGHDPEIVGAKLAEDLLKQGAKELLT